MTFSETIVVERQQNLDEKSKTLSITSTATTTLKSVANVEPGPKIFIQTPLIESTILRKYSAQRKVYLKLENCQPSGSFKLRGLSNLCKYAKFQGYERFVCPSGGNAGLATAYSAMKLNMPCHIVVNSQTPESTCETIRSFGATVEISGNCLDDSVKRAELLAEEDPKLLLIHPFDHQAIWNGHSTIMDEVVEELGRESEPSMIVTCCGGGGLICGLIQGCRRYGWTRTKILSMESDGCHSLNLSIKNNGKLKRLDKITSIVNCLSLNEVCQKILDDFHLAKPRILSRVIHDGDAAEACLRFADDHRMLVGLACGTCLAALYKGHVERILTKQEDEKEKIYDKVLMDIDGNPIDEDDSNDQGPVIVIVCGGAEISLADIEDYKTRFDLNV